MSKDRSSRRRLYGNVSSEGLEGRGLLSVGMGGVVDVLRELGPVSPAAAAQGVAATASIDSGHAVTFRFEVEEGGNYTLFVRHDGAGLTLTAQTPAGTATIDAGAAGPFEEVPLALKQGTYEVTAAARGGQPLFVDWELLLNSGIGQAAATKSSAILPLVAVPMINSALPSGAVTPGNPGATAPVAAVAASVNAPAMPSLAQSDTSAVPMYLLGQPVGRMGTDPSAAPSVMPLISEATELLALQPLSGLNITLVAGIQPAMRGDVPAKAAPAETSWFDALAQAIASDVPVEHPQVAALAVSQPVADSRCVEAEASAVSIAAISPEMILGAVVLTMATRRLIKSNRQFFAQTPANLDHLPDSPLHRLRAIFDRSYRAGRCQQPVCSLRVTPIYAPARLGPHAGSRRSW